VWAGLPATAGMDWLSGIFGGSGTARDAARLGAAQRQPHVPQSGLLEVQPVLPAPGAVCDAQPRPGDVGTVGGGGCAKLAAAAAMSPRISPLREAGPSSPRAARCALVSPSPRSERGGLEAGRGPTGEDTSPRRSPRLSPGDGVTPRVTGVAPIAQPPAGVPPAPGVTVGDAAPADIPFLRSIEELRNHSKFLSETADIPDGFPQGPFATADEAVKGVRAYTLDRSTNGYSHGVIKESKKPAATGRAHHGPRVTIRCENYKTDKCKWAVYFEQCRDGWAVQRFSKDDSGAHGHSHALVTSLVEALARSNQREIPEDLLPIARRMKRSGSRPDKIFKFLVESVKERGAEATFVYKDVYDAVHASTSDREFDATDLADWLAARHGDLGLFSRTKTDPDGCLSHAFIQLQSSAEIYSHESDKQVVQIDTKVRCLASARSRHSAPHPFSAQLSCASLQHGTNKYGMKLLSFVTVDGTGATKVLATCLLPGETIEDFEWGLQCFYDCFRVPPAVLISDSAPAIKAAVAHVFPEPRTYHHLCIWHLSKNMLTALRPACGGDNRLWGRVRTLWWRIAKETDARTRNDFDREWVELSELIKGSAATESAKTAALDWLAARAADSQRWAYRYTWARLTLGAHSTQRIEAFHSALMHWLSSSMLLTELCKRMDDYVLDVRVAAAVRDLHYLARLHKVAGDAARAPSPLVAYMERLGVTPFALCLLRVQKQQAEHYTVQRGPDVGTYMVSRLDLGGPCSAVRGLEEDGDDAAADPATDVDLGIAQPEFLGQRARLVEIDADGVVSCSCQYQLCYGLPCRHVMRVIDVNQLSVERLLAPLVSARWKCRSPEAVTAAVQALFERQRPGRADVGAPSQLGRADRRALFMSLASEVAKHAEESADKHEWAMQALRKLMTELRGNGPATAWRPSRCRRGGAGPRQVPPARGGGRAGDIAPTSGALAFHPARRCTRCNALGHNIRTCPQEEPPPSLREGETRVGAFVVTRRLRRRGEDATAPRLAAAEDGPTSESEENSNVCHACSDGGHLECCDGQLCNLSWHVECMEKEDLVEGVNGLWLCPVCTGRWAQRDHRYVANPRLAAPGRGGNQRQARKRGHDEGTVEQRAAAKRAARGKSVAMLTGFRRR